MPVNPDSPGTLLGTELTGALDRSLMTSLSSLVSLRDAVRSYTIHQRNNGVSLNDIVKGARGVLAEAEDGRNGHSTSAPARDGELARHLEEWCQHDFREHR